MNKTSIKKQAFAAHLPRPNDALTNAFHIPLLGSSFSIFKTGYEQYITLSQKTQVFFSKAVEILVFRSLLFTKYKKFGIIFVKELRIIPVSVVLKKALKKRLPLVTTLFVVKAKI